MSDTTAPQDWCVVHGRAKVRRDVAGFACWECPYCNAEVFTIPPAAVPVAAVERYPRPASAEEAEAVMRDVSERGAHESPDDGFNWFDTNDAEPILDPELRQHFVEQVQAMKTGSPFLKTMVLRFAATVRHLLAHTRAVEAEREAAQEVVAAARCFVECSVRHDRTPYISENGRHGGSPWAELLDAIAAVDRAAAAASPARE